MFGLLVQLIQECIKGKQDDYTVERVIDVFTTQQGDLWLFDEQLRRWEHRNLTSVQRQEVERLLGQMLQLHEVINAILRPGGRVE